ncbi:Uncharacterised protein [Vibrio cholerae]|nr:Uncharacterised protein [Vibrio cholerae]
MLHRGARFYRRFYRGKVSNDRFNAFLQLSLHFTLMS